MSNPSPNPPFKSWSFTQILIVLVVVVACGAIAYYAAQEMGVVIPHFFVMAMWIVGIAVVAVLAIKFIASLL